MLNKALFIVILVIFLPVVGFSQKKSKKQRQEANNALVEFLEVCNLYKKTPLRLEVEYNQVATFKVSAQDSVNVKGEFFLTDDGAYIRFGNTEQLVTDSLMLMVSLDRPVMMTFRNPLDIKARLNSYFGLQMMDSSLRELEKNYVAIYLQQTKNDEKVIELRSKAALPGTDVIKEVITLKYKAGSKEPVEVNCIRKTLIPLEKDDLPSFASMSDKIVHIKENDFLINERKGVFEYKTIDHNPAMKLPVALSDRLRTDGNGKLAPARGFEHYYLNVE